MKRLLMIVAGLVWAIPVQAASFDCAKAGTKVEKLICADAELSKLDERMVKNYADVFKVFPVPAALKFRQKQWLNRRNACEQEELDQSIPLCLKNSYEQRLAEMDSLVKEDLPCPELPIIKIESEKAHCMKRWLARHPLELNRDHMPEQDQKFCTKFYQALATASPEVHYIEPVLRTEDPQHPDLVKYRQCRDIEAVGLGYDYQGLDEEAHGFRLYQVDLDGNPKNGLEEYLYEEESSGSMKNGSTQYVRVRFSADQCVVDDSPSAWAEEPRRTGIPMCLGLNAMIYFRDKPYILDLCDSNWLDVAAYESKAKKFASDKQCKWRTSRHFSNEQKKGVSHD